MNIISQSVLETLDILPLVQDLFELSLLDVPSELSCKEFLTKLRILL